MKKQIIYSSLILALFAFTSCEDTIDIDLDQGPTLLVIDGKVTDEPNISHKVTLSTTAPYFENNKTPRVSGAFVEITDIDANGSIVSIDTLIETIPNSGDYFTTKTNGLLGHKYILRVTALGESYKAESIVNRVPPIDSITFEYKEKTANTDAGYSVFYYGPEPQGVGDHYLFRVSKNGKPYSKPNQLYFTSDELVDGNYINNVDITPEPFQLGDTITIEDFTTTKDQYKFYAAMYQQVNNGGLFANPPSNVHTNIVNTNPNGKKAVGYFGAHGYQKITRIIQ